MSEERKMILEMLKEGTISNEEAIRLLDAIGEGEKKSRFQDKDSSTEKLLNGISSLINGAMSAATTVVESIDFDHLDFTSKTNAKVEKSKRISIEGLDLPQIQIDNQNGMVEVEVVEDELVDEVFCEATIQYNNKYYAEDYDFLELILEENLLKIQIRRDAHGAYGNINANLKVRLPKRAYESVRVTTTNAKVEGSGLETGLLKVKTNNGKIEFQDIRAKVVELKTSNGGIDLKNITGEILNARTSNGRVYAKDLHVEEIMLTTSNGNLSVSHPSDQTKTMELKSGNGSISVKDLVFSRKIKATIKRYNRHSGNFYLSEQFTSVNNRGNEIIAHNGVEEESDLEILAVTTNGGVTLK